MTFKPVIAFLAYYYFTATNNISTSFKPVHIDFQSSSTHQVWKLWLVLLVTWVILCFHTSWTIEYRMLGNDQYINKSSICSQVTWNDRAEETGVGELHTTSYTEKNLTGSSCQRTVYCILCYNYTFHPTKMCLDLPIWFIWNCSFLCV